MKIFQLAFLYNNMLAVLFIKRHGSPEACVTELPVRDKILVEK